MPYIDPITLHPMGTHSPSQRNTVQPHVGKFLVLMCFFLHFLTGCVDNDFDSLGGQALGEPVNAIYGIDPETDSYMVIISTIPNLCQKISNLTPPTEDEYWFITWSSLPGFTSYATTKSGDETQTFTGRFDKVELDKDCPLWDWLDQDPSDCILRGQLDITFDSGDQVSGDFEAYYCAANLFNGL